MQCEPMQEEHYKEALKIFIDASGKEEGRVGI